MFSKTPKITILEEQAAVNIFSFLQNFSHNRLINFRPPPQTKHLLDFPIKLNNPPRIVLRQRRFYSKISEAILSPLMNDDQKFRRNVHFLIAGIMASVWPQTAKDLKERGWLDGFYSMSRRNNRILHPCDLDHAFETLYSIPNEMQTERRALEMILATILREYQTRISSLHGEHFSFEAEARLRGLVGYRIERLMRHIKDRGEQADTIQEIYNCYYNAARYYQYSVISKEPQKNDGTLFNIYCRSIIFNAHVRKGGRISDKITWKELPSRERVMFFVLRDSALRRRYNSDPEYAAKIKGLVKLFPSSLANI
ncbi:MAG: hypothetical protein WCJ64_11450 [Rhodospirillaceae bacterium]